MEPKLAVSGYRGIWGKTLTHDIARDYVSAFGRFIEKGPVLVGRDGRASGPELSETVIQTLMSMGIDVIDLGMCPTPTVLFLIRETKSAGAVIITASHNPIEYNGLKFATGKGAFTTEEDVEKIEELRKESSPETKPGKRIDGGDLFEKHLENILSHIDVPSIRKKAFKVALDPINSVGCTTTPLLLSDLGVTYEIINGNPDGNFAHEPEPLPKNLSSLKELVIQNKSDVGFAQDPDGDRLVLCDETGDILSEEEGVALCIWAILEKTPGDVVINLSTSNMSEDIASMYGVRTWRSKVGEANVTALMREKHAVAGGEGGGGVIWPEVNPTRDSFSAIALILDLMAKKDTPLSKIREELPRYHMVKEKFSFEGSRDDVYKKMRTLFPDGEYIDIDGLRIDFPDRSWIHVRPSNTEPVLRIIAESKDKEQASTLVEKTKEIL